MGVQRTVLEDNDAVIKIVLKCRTIVLRHVLQTHRVALDWLYERFQDQPMRLQYINTKLQLADMFTKHFRTADPWKPLCYMLGLHGTGLVPIGTNNFVGTFSVLPVRSDFSDDEKDRTPARDVAPLPSVPSFPSWGVQPQVAGNLNSSCSP